VFRRECGPRCGLLPIPYCYAAPRMANSQLELPHRDPAPNDLNDSEWPGSAIPLVPLCSIRFD